MITSIKSLIPHTCITTGQTFFFLEAFHQKQFIHNTGADVNGRFKRGIPGAPRSEIENGDNTVEVVIHNYLRRR